MSLLKSSGLFVVNQDDTNYAISTDVLKEYIAPLAKQELGDPYDPGQPGLIMPGDGFVYDETTGLLEINIPSGIVYVGLIGSDQNNGEVLEPDPYGEVPGHFYIVAEEVTLCNDVWPGITNDPSGCKEVHINDKVIMNNDEEWDVIPAITEDFVHVGPTPPNDPAEGNLWWESEIEKELYIWVLDAYGNGSWEPATPATRVEVGPTPPSDPQEGDLWWQKFDDNEMYIWVLDPYGNGEWKPVSTGGSQVILSPTEPYYIDAYGNAVGDPVDTGTLWVDDTTFDMYVWEGDAWVQVSSSGSFVATCILSPTPPYLIDAYGNETGQKVSKGTLWVDSNTFNMYVWDGDAWAQVSGVGSGGGGTTNIVEPYPPFQPDAYGNETNDQEEEGTIWINSTNNESYYWDGSAWNTIMIDIETLPKMDRNP